MKPIKIHSVSIGDIVRLIPDGEGFWRFFEDEQGVLVVTWETKNPVCKN